ncbi:hypothetical protein SUGI_0210160 [Cryptomeria japonica]|nr:hypothetical protein SUGI_0210160 [Cryptomeria japonica]
MERQRSSLFTPKSAFRILETRYLPSKKAAFRFAKCVRHAQIPHHSLEYHSKFLWAESRRCRTCVRNNGNASSNVDGQPLRFFANSTVNPFFFLVMPSNLPFCLL